ncbi:MAG: DUF5131 family protein [Gemmatimonadaceae bacterium]
MADTTIEWTDTTWNPTTGCDRVSPGCDNCYALTLAKRLKAMGSAKYQRDGDPKTSGPGFGVSSHADVLDEPLTWRKPRKVFVNSMSDLFHNEIPDRFIGEVFSVMGATPRHTYQILTKRHARMRSLLQRWTDHLTIGCHCPSDEGGCSAPVDVLHGVWPLPNVWLGVSVENQEWANIRIPALLQTRAAIRFISAEPLLGPVSLSRWTLDWDQDEQAYLCQMHGMPDCTQDLACRGLDWVIAGGESGPGARPMHPDWARSLRDQCEDAGVAYHFKQFGAWAPWFSHGEGEEGPGDTFVNLDGTTGHAWFNEDLGYPTNYSGAWGEDSHLVSRVGKKRAGRELDGLTHDEFPPDPSLRLADAG